MTGCVLFLLSTWVPAQESTQHVCRADVRLGCVLAFEFCLSVCLSASHTRSPHHQVLLLASFQEEFLLMATLALRFPSCIQGFPTHAVVSLSPCG